MMERRGAYRSWLGGLALLSLVVASAGAGAKPRRTRKTTPTDAGKQTPAATGPTGSVDASVTPGDAAETGCAACHTAEGWSSFRFAHDRTGFPLRGRHNQVSCKDCHASTFTAPLPKTCGACHRDPHGGELGLDCLGCHDEESWRSRFGAEAHRRTSFPLVGRHAALPCVSCHPNIRDRAFTHTAVACESCHLRDYQRTAGSPVDHVAAGFGLRCQECHGPWRFGLATVPQHDVCFTQGGPHAGIRCGSCHTSLPQPLSWTGTCNTQSAACSSCHEHSCSEMDEEHGEVAGYQCKDRKCYECHRFAR